MSLGTLPAALSHQGESALDSICFGSAKLIRAAPLGGVVVHVPARALEVEARRGQRALKHALALGAFCSGSARSSGFFQIDGRIGCSDRHTKARFSPLREEIPHCYPLYRQGGNSLQNCGRPRSLSLSSGAASQCTANEATDAEWSSHARVIVPLAPPMSARV